MRGYAREKEVMCAKFKLGLDCNLLVTKKLLKKHVFLKRIIAKNIENERLEMKRRKNLNFEKNLAAKLNILVPMLRK